MENVFVIGAVVGGSLLVVGVITLVAGLLLTDETAGGGEPGVWDKIAEFVMKWLGKLMDTILGTGSRATKVRAAGLLLILVGGLLLGGCIYGAIESGDGSTDSPPGTTTTTTTTSGS